MLRAVAGCSHIRTFIAGAISTRLGAVKHHASGAIMNETTKVPVLVTGGAGFIGSNLADRLADDGHRVVVYDAMTRPGVERNLAWLQSRHPDRIDHVQADIRDAARLAACIRDAKVVFHMAAQVAVIHGMQGGATSAAMEGAIRDMLLAHTGNDLTHLKNTLNLAKG